MSQADALDELKALLQQRLAESAAEGVVDQSLTETVEQELRSAADLRGWTSLPD